MLETSKRFASYFFKGEHFTSLTAGSAFLALADFRVLSVIGFLFVYSGILVDSHIQSSIQL